MRIDWHTNGPRVYLLGLRVHHGLTGCALLIVGLARAQRTLVRVGLALIADDLHDFPWRLRERSELVSG